MKATEQYFPVVLFITLYKVVLTFESVTILMQDLAHLSSDSVCLLITVLENKMWKGWVLFCVNAVPTYFEKKYMEKYSLTLSAFHFFIEVFTIIRVLSIPSNMLVEKVQEINTTMKFSLSCLQFSSRELVSEALFILRLQGRQVLSSLFLWCILLFYTS